MRTLTLVVNPEAGHGSGRLLTPRLEADLRDAGVEPVTTLAESAEHAAQVCAAAVASDVAGLAVVGGDAERIGGLLRASFDATAPLRDAVAAAGAALGSSQLEVAVLERGTGRRRAFRRLAREELPRG